LLVFHFCFGNVDGAFGLYGHGKPKQKQKMIKTMRCTQT